MAANEDNLGGQSTKHEDDDDNVPNAGSLITMGAMSFD